MLLVSRRSLLQAAALAPARLLPGILRVQKRGKVRGSDHAALHSRDRSDRWYRRPSRTTHQMAMINECRYRWLRLRELNCGAQRACRTGRACMLGPLGRHPLDLVGYYRSPREKHLPRQEKSIAYEICTAFGTRAPRPASVHATTSGFPVWPIARIGCGDPRNHIPAKAIRKSRLSRLGFPLRRHHAIAVRLCATFPTESRHR